MNSISWLKEHRYFSACIVFVGVGLIFHFGFSHEYKDVICRWQTACVGAIATFLAAFGYFAASDQLKVSVIIQEATREQAKIAALAQQSESMFRLEEAFDKDTFKKNRSDAAKNCLKNLAEQKPDEAVDDVLDLFEDAAFLVEIGAMDIRMVWHIFFYWIQLYWQASEAYIAEVRKDEPTQWAALAKICPLLCEVEAAERQKLGVAGPYDWKLSPAELRDRLQKETVDEPQAPGQGMAV